MALLKRGLLKGGRGRLHTCKRGNDIIFSISVGNQKVFKKIDIQFLLLLIMLYTKALEGFAFE